jgi:hypothetical protein
VSRTPANATSGRGSRTDSEAGLRSEADEWGEGETEISGLVEERCEESAGVCEESVVGDSGGEEVEAVAWGGGAQGDETWR